MSADLTSATNKTEIIFVKLTDEIVDVWRPVHAENLGQMIYRILPDDFDPDIETWEFLPGQTVKVELQTKSEGKILVAVTAIQVERRFDN